jgi:hypothetical protein
LIASVFFQYNGKKKNKLIASAVIDAHRACEKKGDNPWRGIIPDMKLRSTLLRS